MAGRNTTAATANEKPVAGVDREEDESRPLLANATRAADLLMLFANSDQSTLGVSEIARELDLSKAVVHRLLTTFVAKGLIELNEDTRRYGLGPMTLHLGMSYLGRIDLRSIVLPYLARLSAEVNETATLSFRTKWTRHYLEQVTPDREVKMTVSIGHSYPLHAGSSSKALLAFLPEEEIEQYLATHQLSRLTEHTIVDPDALREELARVRRQGFATSRGERQFGAASIAAPVFDRHNIPIASVSVCGPAERFTSSLETARRSLVAACGEISHRMGASMVANR